MMKTIILYILMKTIFPLIYILIVSAVKIHIVEMALYIFSICAQK